jgi:hypothetical protein
MSARGKPDPRAPVIAGAGQVVQRPGESEALDPIALTPAALRRAAAGTRALAHEDDEATAAAFLERDPLGETIAIAAGESPRLALAGRPRA